jgi:hypothetical protein
MKTLFTTLALLASTLAAGAAEPADSELGRCRTLAEATARLACYDALPLPPAPPAPPQAAAKPAAPAPVVLAGPAPVPSSAAATPAPAAVALTPEAAFGLESRRSAVQDIRSTLPGLFEGWDRNTRFTLANGQVWQVSDGSAASVYLRDPAVTVRRAAMGSFRLEIAGTNQAPRVVRVD